MTWKNSSLINYLGRYGTVHDAKERCRLKNELMQEIICNLIYVYGPQRWSDITTYFGTTSGRKASKSLRDNMKTLTDENWGTDQLIKVRYGRYVINDSWGPDPPVKFENGIYVIVINDLRKDD